MNRHDLAKPKKKLHPRDSSSPEHHAWKRSIGQGVRGAAKRRRKGGLLSVRDLAKRGPFTAQAINRFMDAGELLFVPLGLHRFVFAEEFARFLRSKIKGGEAA
jgi:hypothetical protein